MAGIRLDRMITDWDVLVVFDNRILGQRKKDGRYFYEEIGEDGARGALERLQTHTDCECDVGIPCFLHGGTHATS